MAVLCLVWKQCSIFIIVAGEGKDSTDFYVCMWSKALNCWNGGLQVCLHRCFWPKMSRRLSASFTNVTSRTSLRGYTWKLMPDRVVKLEVRDVGSGLGKGAGTTGRAAVRKCTWKTCKASIVLYPSSKSIFEITISIWQNEVRWIGKNGLMTQNHTEGCESRRFL